MSLPLALRVSKYKQVAVLRAISFSDWCFIFRLAPVLLVLELTVEWDFLNATKHQLSN